MYLKTNVEHLPTLCGYTSNTTTDALMTTQTGFYSKHSSKLKLSISDNTDENKIM